MAQSFVGKRTLVTDVYPLKSQKQFVNTLEDNIRFRGAMTKLISDYAKVEISNKVKDILRMYHSSSRNSEPFHQNQNPAEGRVMCSHSRSRFAFAIRDTIGCGMTWGDVTMISFTFSRESCWRVTKSVAFLESL